MAYGASGLHKATALIVEGAIVALVVAYFLVEGVQDNMALNVMLVAIALPSAVLILMTLFDKGRKA